MTAKAMKLKLKYQFSAANTFGGNSKNQIGARIENEKISKFDFKRVPKAQM